MKSIKNITKKSMSAILALAIVLVSLPLTIFAMGNDEDNSFYSSNIDVGSVNKDIIELKDKRTRNSKTFRLEDGSYYVAQYDVDVHSLDENGMWQDIDNTLSVSGSEIQTKDAKIKFAKKITGNESLFTIHSGNRKLSLSLNGASKGTGVSITNRKTEFGDSATALQKMTTLDYIAASVKYENILSGTDIEYVVNGTNIKENIIVKEKQSSYTYSFTLSLNNMEARLDGNGEIVISDSKSGETIYTIPKSFMYDENRANSYDIEVTLAEKNNGDYILTLIPSSVWMNAEERMFPVTIDPPLVVPNDTDLLDVNISSENVEYNFPYNDEIYVSSTWRAYWKVGSLPTLPTSAYITNAEITLDYRAGGTSGGYIAVYDVLTDWDSTLTYSKTLSTTNPAGVPAEKFTDFQEVVSLTDNNENISDYCWNITPIVKKWYSGQNYGLMFAATESAENSQVDTAVAFSSNEYSDSSKQPRLTVTYTDMKGVEDYWPYSSHSLGFAGSGYVNNATGNLVFSVPTITTTDALMPFTPTLVYNSVLAGKAYNSSNTQSAYATAFTPMGFKLNISETLLKKSYTDENGSTKYMFVLADSDGTEHYFMPTTTSGIYRDEDGLQLTLYEGTLSASNLCEIKDSSHNIRAFTQMSSTPSVAVSGWYLSSITDKSGNKLTFGFDSSHRPVSVNLIPNNSATVEQLKLSYDSGGMLCTVWNDTSKEGVTFRYLSTATGSLSITNGKYLRHSIRVHGTSDSTEADIIAFYNTNYNSSTSKITVDAISQYTYNSSGYIIAVTNRITKYKTEYTYDSSNRVSAVVEKAGTSYVAGQQLSISYGTSSSVVQTSGTDDTFGNSDDLITTYNFDSNGRTVSCYTTDLNRTQIYGASSGQYVGEENDNAKNNLKSSVNTVRHSSNYLLNGGFETTSTNSVPYWSKTGTVICETAGMAHVGSGCAEIRVNSSTTSSSVYQNVYLDKGKYSLNMYINTDEVPSSVKVYLKAESLSNSAHSVTQEVSVNECYATGAYAFAGLNFEADPSTTNGKEQFKISVVVSGAPSSTESIWIDNVMLSKTTGAAEFDFVQTGSFENSSASYSPSTFWSDANNSSYTISVVDSGIAAFGDVLKIDSSLGTTHNISQTVYSATSELKAMYDSHAYVETPMMFTVSGWGKGTAQSYADTSMFSISAVVKYYDGGSGSTESFDFDFDKGISDWQFASGGFLTNPDKGIIDTVTLIIKYSGHSGIGYFDDISVVKDSNNATAYDYNANGYVTTYKSGRNQSWYEYDSNNNLTKEISSNKYIIEYDYDTFNRVTAVSNYDITGYYNYATDSFVVQTQIATNNTQYSYNGFGLVVSTATYDNTVSGQSVIATTTEYNVSSGSHIFGTVKSETDSLQNKTYYFYDNASGRLLSTIYPNGNGSSYTYDAIGNLIEVLPAKLQTDKSGYLPQSGSVDVSYTYDSETKRLSSISTNSTTYTFVYDIYGNTASVSVGSQSLASYTYNANNGKLNTINYGNGFSVKYVYDVLDRISEIMYNVGTGGAYVTVYTYTYDSAGNLFSVTDHVNDEVTMCKYNAEGNLVQTYVYDSETYTNLYGSSIYYDEQSRVSIIFHSLDYLCPSGVTEYDQVYYSYMYDDVSGDLKKVSYDGYNVTGEISPEYDELGRTTYKTIDFNVNYVDAFYNRIDYDYKTYYTNESGLVSKYTSKTGKNSSSVTTVTYNYTYDVNGNITQITDASGVIQNKYYYDDLGQLTREDNKAKNYSYTYEYDNAGNITAKKRYAFTTGSLGSVQYTYDYTYSTSSWGDLLVNYGSDKIEYDAIGNPTKIGYYYDEYSRWGSGAELEWQGRQLMSYSMFEDYPNSSMFYTRTYSYTYNADGIRTNKNINGVEHRYTLSGSQIISETWTENGTEYLMIYLYDETGAPLGIKYRTSAYAADVFDYFFFEKNLQGDIAAIYNANGVKIGSYTYDAWGVVTSTAVSGTTTLERNILSINPFRYRGYYYDTETGFYYVSSRYYNPTFCRFINSDSQLNTSLGLLGCNLFAYCLNNPSNMIDYSGNKPGDLFNTIDEAALDFAICYNELSINDKQEYGSAIYKVRTTQTTYVTVSQVHRFLWLTWRTTSMKPIKTTKIQYSYTKPSIGKKGNSVMPNFATLKPIVSTVHTHGNYDPKYDNENFSSGFASDLGWSNFFHMDSYVVTPGGYLKKYTYANRNSKNGGISIISDDIPWDVNSPHHVN